MTVGSVAIPGLNEQAFAKNPLHESETQSKQGDHKSDTTREGPGDHEHTDYLCPSLVGECDGMLSEDRAFLNMAT